MSPFYPLFIIIAAFIFAKLEIEIEGAHGWAAELPTWRVEKHLLLDIFFGGRPLTGYHVWAFAFVCCLFHLPFFLYGTWSWRGEAYAIGGYSLFWVVEDFLWFGLNPHFGWKKFSQQYIWWHKRWFLRLPVDYWVFGGAGIALLALP